MNMKVTNCSSKRGHTPEHLTGEAISRRFPAWKPEAFVDGFFHAQGGYVESGRVVAALVRLAQSKGVMLYPDQTVETLIEESSHIKGVRTRSGNTFHAEHVVVASGAWTALLVPDLAPFVKVTGHPIFHLKPANPAIFTHLNLSYSPPTLQRRAGMVSHFTHVSTWLK